MAWNNCDVIVTYFFVFVTSSMTYPQGVPLEACDTMFPKHGASPQISNPPFRLTLATNTYNVGQQRQPIRVTLNCDNTAFKGVMIQARSLTNCSETVGIFQLDISEARLKLTSCQRHQDTVTHRNANGKTTLSFDWMPPPMEIGPVFISATIVQTRAAFWTAVTSDVIFHTQFNDVTTLSCPPSPPLSPLSNEIHDESGIHHSFSPGTLHSGESGNDERIPDNTRINDANRRGDDDTTKPNESDNNGRNDDSNTRIRGGNPRIGNGNSRTDDSQSRNVENSRRGVDSTTKTSDVKNRGNHDENHTWKSNDVERASLSSFSMLFGLSFAFIVAIRC